MKYPRKQVTVICAGCGTTAPSSQAQTSKYPLLPIGWAQGGMMKNRRVAYWCRDCFEHGKAYRQEFANESGPVLLAPRGGGS